MRFAFVTFGLRECRISPRWLLLVLVGLVVMGCRKSPDAGSAAAPVAASKEGERHVAFADEDYVGSSRCAACHAEIARTYLETHSMSRAMSRAGEETPLEDYSKGVFSPSGNRTYQVERTAAEITHHEIMFDRSGEPIFNQAEPIAYVLGSGRRGRSYLIDRDGLLFQSPIAWYSQQRRWALAPGYGPADHVRFDRRVRLECVFCHAGLTRMANPANDRYAQPALIEGGISCERCHGPGRRHVEAQEAGSAAAPDDTIVNPIRLGATQRDSVCYQCHLRAKSIFPRQGQRFTDFRPGAAYHDHWLAFVDREEEGSPAASLVQQFRSSRCFVGSQGRMGCVSCHDPHSRPAETERASYYQSRCLQCHAEQGCALDEQQRLAEPAAGSCIHCHMPPLPIQDIPHTALTDHRLPRVSSAAQMPSAPAQPRGEYDDLDLFLESELPPEEVNRGWALVHAIRATHSSDQQSAMQALERLQLDPADTPTEMLRQLGDDMPVLERIGIPLAMLGRTDLALQVWERALELEPTNEAVLHSLALFYSRSGDPLMGLKYIDRLLAVNPYLAEYQWLRSRLLEQAGQFDEAVRAAERTVQLDPTAISVRAWLIDAYQRGNQPAKAQQQREIMERMRGV